MFTRSNFCFNLVKGFADFIVGSFREKTHNIDGDGGKEKARNDFVKADQLNWCQIRTVAAPVNIPAMAPYLFMRFHRG